MLDWFLILSVSSHLKNPIVRYNRWHLILKIHIPAWTVQKLMPPITPRDLIMKPAQKRSRGNDIMCAPLWINVILFLFPRCSLLAYAATMWSQWLSLESFEQFCTILRHCKTVYGLVGVLHLSDPSSPWDLIKYPHISHPMLLDCTKNSWVFWEFLGDLQCQGHFCSKLWLPLNLSCFAILWWLSLPLTALTQLWKFIPSLIYLHPNFKNL